MIGANFRIKINSAARLEWNMLVNIYSFVELKYAKRTVK